MVAEHFPKNLFSGALFIFLNRVPANRADHAVGRPSALAFSSWFHIVISHRGLTPHKFTPMLGVHKRLLRTG